MLPCIYKNVQTKKQQKARLNDLSKSAAKIKELTIQLNGYKHEYYNLNSPIITDADYDKLVEELDKLEKETGIILSNSPTQTVGFILADLKQISVDLNGLNIQQILLAFNQNILLSIKTFCMMNIYFFKKGNRT